MITKYTTYINEASKSDRNRMKEKRLNKVEQHNTLLSYIDNKEKFIEYLDNLYEEESVMNFIDIITHETNYKLFDYAFEYILKKLIEDQSKNIHYVDMIFLDNYEYFLKETKNSEKNFKLLIDLLKININNTIYIMVTIVNIIYSSNLEFFNKIQKEIDLIDIKNFFEKNKEYRSITRSFEKDMLKLLHFFVYNKIDKYVYEIIDNFYGLKLDNTYTFLSNYNSLLFDEKQIQYLFNKYKDDINDKNITRIIFGVIETSEYSKEENIDRDKLCYIKLRRLIEYFSNIKVVINKQTLINAIRYKSDDLKSDILKLFFGQQLTFLQYLKLNTEAVYQELHRDKGDEHLIELFNILADYKFNKIWNNVKYLFMKNHGSDYVKIYKWLDKYDLVKYIPTEMIILLNYTQNDNLELIKELIEKYFDNILKLKILDFFYKLKKEDSSSGWFNFKNCRILDLELKKNSSRVFNSFIKYDNYKDLIDWYCLKLIDNDENMFVHIKNLVSSSAVLKNHQHLVNANNFDLI